MQYSDRLKTSLIGAWQDGRAIQLRQKAAFYDDLDSYTEYVPPRSQWLFCLDGARCVYSDQLWGDHVLPSVLVVSGLCMQAWVCMDVCPGWQ